MSTALVDGSSRGAAAAALRRAFAAAGLDTPALDARVLAGAALGVDAAVLLARPEVPLSDGEIARLEEFARRRLAREPVQRILGWAEFWGLRFDLAPDTLVPRPDTETLVREALSLAPDRTSAQAIIDLGTGTGCILIALLHELPRATGLGIDRSPAALATARRNACSNGVGARASFAASDWGAAVTGFFDLVVSNPPYIRTREVPGLDPEVARFDPCAALDGGCDGLDAYRAVLDAAGRILAPGGHVVLEIGHDQRDDVCGLAPARGFGVVRVAADLAGRPRAVVLGRSEVD